MGKKIARIIGRVLLVVLVTIVMLVGTLFIMIKRICSDSAPAARNLFISTVLESGQMKFLASWFCTDAQINEVINANKMESMDSDIDTSLINISTDTQTVDNNGEAEQFDGNGIRMVEISGRSFFGKMLDSVALSEKISDLMVKGNSHIVLVIGGSLGIADEVLKRADEKISFSKMTFPHQLMRVILLEQLYRSYRIINHEPYHK